MKKPEILIEPNINRVNNKLDFMDKILTDYNSINLGNIINLKF
jgi:hypothetical protein